MAAELKLKPEVTPQVGKLLIKRRKELLNDLAELERDCFEPAPTLGGGTLDPVHPNHRADLRYVLQTLEQVVPVVKKDAALRERVEAAINGMRYVLRRTEEAAARGVGRADHKTEEPK